MRRGRVVLPALGAGVLVAASVPPWGYWELAFPGLGLLAWGLAGLRARHRALTGLVFGLALFAPTLTWTLAFSGPGYAALVLLESLFLVGACLLVPPGRGRALAFPGAIVLAQAARSAWPFGGFPMGGIPLGQADGPLLATARVGGPLLITGLVAAGGVCLAEAAHWLGARRGRGARAGGVGRGARAALAAGLAVVAAVGTAGLAPAGGPPVGHTRVGLVQGGGPRGLRAIMVNPATIYHAQLAATGLLHPPLDLVVWPEDVISLNHPLRGSPVASQMGALARSLNATVIAGVTEPVGATRFRNRVVAWSPTGRIIGSYEKVHRVPFGEYVPFRSVLRHIVNLADVPRDAIPGHRPGFLATPAGPIGVMISYEVFFAARARAATRAGAEVLTVPTNTSSYASSKVPKEELAADRLRAVEEGRDLVQASPVGYTDVVGHDGAVRQHSALGPRQVIQAVVARRSGLTLYEQGGSLPELVLAAVLVLVGAAAGLVDTRRGRAGQAGTSPALRRRAEAATAPRR